VTTGVPGGLCRLWPAGSSRPFLAPARYARRFAWRWTDMKLALLTCALLGALENALLLRYSLTGMAHFHTKLSGLVGGCVPGGIAT
jgi:hypothetical protein